MLNNMKVSRRLFVLIALFFVLLVTLSFVAYLQLDLIQKNYSEIADNILPSVNIMGEIRNAANRVAIAERNHILNMDGELMTELEQTLAQEKDIVNQRLQEYEQLVLEEDGEAVLFQAVKDRWAAYLQVHEQVLVYSRQNKDFDARILSSNQGNDAFRALTLALADEMAFNNTLSESHAQAAKTEANQTRALMIIIPVLAGILTVTFGMVIARSITGPLTQLQQVTRSVAEGDLNRRAQESGSELGELSHAFNQMADQLRARLDDERSQRQHLQETVQEYVVYLNDVARGNLAQRVKVTQNGGGANDPLVLLGRNLNEMTASLQRMIQQIQEASTNLSSAASEILAATTQQASGASEQSAAIAQTTTTVDELRAIAEQSTIRTRDVTTSAQRTVEVSRTGQQAVQDNINSMLQIKGRVEGIAANILALSEQTQQIGEIIATVNEIASQSNMLALNASVEAARAGEHGKGFAVVASEVRSLAEQSRHATAQVKEILSEIQKATNATVMATEEGTKGVEQGVQLATQTRQSIDQLSSAISEMAQSSVQMNAGSQQQVAGVEQVSMAMQHINQATVQSLSSTRQAERAAQTLNELAKHLNELISQYRF